jgi:hypothetical protein
MGAIVRAVRTGQDTTSARLACVMSRSTHPHLPSRPSPDGYLAAISDRPGIPPSDSCLVSRWAFGSAQVEMACLDGGGKCLPGAGRDDQFGSVGVFGVADGDGSGEVAGDFYAVAACSAAAGAFAPGGAGEVW